MALSKMVKGTDLVSEVPKIDLNIPNYDQSSYLGRAKHFFEVTNPATILLSKKKLFQAKELLEQYKNGKAPPNTTVNDIRRAKRYYKSAFHPETGELMFLPGRMSFQAPGNMVISGCMLAFQTGTPAVVFWQWANQSYNASVNYVNRSGKSVPYKDLFVPYIFATGGAVASALALKEMVVKFVPPLVGKFVPYFAVAVANCINIPLMRHNELQAGITIKDSEGNELGKSKQPGLIPLRNCSIIQNYMHERMHGIPNKRLVAARKAIAKVLFSRICLAGPPLLLTPVIMDVIERKTTILKQWPKANAPMQIMLVGLILCFANPLCCAIFQQQSSMSVSKVEPEIRKSFPVNIKTVYYNKGL